MVKVGIVLAIWCLGFAFGLRKEKIMSMYDSEKKDEVYDVMADFIKEHSLSELLQILSDVIKNETDREEK